MNRNPPFGRKTIDACSAFPRVDLVIMQKPRECTVTLKLLNPTARTTVRNNPITFYFVAGTVLGGLLEFKKFNVASLKDSPVFSFMANEESIVCSLICSDISKKS